MKYILHIDTSGEKGIVGLSSKGEWLVERTNLQSREHAASINNMITGVLQEAGIGFGDLSAISVIGGPGSYTGLRVGLATAKGFCYAWDLPLIMHNKLTLLALQHLNSNNQVEAIYSALPARQGEYFISKYRKDGVELVIPGHVMEQELIQLLENDIENRTITGVLSKAMQDIAKEMNIEFVENQEITTSFWAFESDRAEHCNSFVNFPHAEPFYLKQVYTHKPSSIS